MPKQEINRQFNLTLMTEDRLNDLTSAGVSKSVDFGNKLYRTAAIDEANRSVAEVKAGEQRILRLLN